MAGIGMLAALMMVLGYLENLMPPLAFLPPGAKLGLGNLVVLYALLRLGLPAALPLALLKAGFAFLLRGGMAGLLSLCGGLLSLCAMVLMLLVWRERASLVGLGIWGAVWHNLGQLGGCMLVMPVAAVLSYLPLLMVFGILAGGVTGTVLAVTMPYLDKAGRL